MLAIQHPPGLPSLFRRTSAHRIDVTCLRRRLPLGRLRCGRRLGRPGAKDGRADAHVGRPRRDRLLKVVRHAHREVQRALLLAQRCRRLAAAAAQRLEIGRRASFGGGVLPDAHEPGEAQRGATRPDALAQGHALGGCAAALGGLARGVDLRHDGERSLPGPQRRHALLELSGQLEGVDSVHAAEARLAQQQLDLVGLQVTDEVQPRVRRQSRALVHQLLHVVLPKVALARLVGTQHQLGWLEL
mmetsp:Transcript_47565/g.154390  ORF Transcript_47565/g.154390 Transcript_47565/m.154390 type:complete len:244 (+) Transcript_47565:41-772(+)